MVKDILDQIQKNTIVSIIRGIDESKITKTVDALYNGGIRAIEFTFDTPGVLRMIERAKIEYGDRITIGAGTVMDIQTTRLAISAGADFILSPILSVEMIEMCNQYSKLAVPGVVTPTEILTAWKAGAQLLKLFPAITFGPEYIKSVKGPLKHVEIMAVGGISLFNIQDFLKSGALALGISSELVNRKVVEEGNFNQISQIAKDFCDIVACVKNNI